MNDALGSGRSSYRRQCSGEPGTLSHQATMRRPAAKSRPWKSQAMEITNHQLLSGLG
ncbi:MAG: hypothetical protein NZ602_01170 [Thermoguttaceae bacterium]|nr:hypothetical protein [Thermoguttaceae bacterium]